MKKMYIVPCNKVVILNATDCLLSASNPVTSQTSLFSLEDEDDAATDQWGRYTGNGYSVFDTDWGN